MNCASGESHCEQFTSLLLGPLSYVWCQSKRYPVNSLCLFTLMFDDTYHLETASWNLATPQRVYMMHTMQSTPHRKRTELSALQTTQDSMLSSQPRLQELQSNKLSIRPPMTGGMRNDLSLIPAFKRLYFWKQRTSLVVDECTPLLVLGSGNSSVVRAPDSWLKGRRFESLQEQQENFLLQGQLSVLTFYFSIRSTPCYHTSM